MRVDNPSGAWTMCATSTSLLQLKHPRTTILITAVKLKKRIVTTSWCLSSYKTGMVSAYRDWGWGNQSSVSVDIRDRYSDVILNTNTLCKYISCHFMLTIEQPEKLGRRRILNHPMRILRLKRMSSSWSWRTSKSKSKMSNPLLSWG